MHRSEPACCGFGNPRPGAGAGIGTPPLPQQFSVERGTPIPLHRERREGVNKVSQVLRIPGPSCVLKQAAGRFCAQRRTRLLRIWKSAPRRWRGDWNASASAAVLRGARNSDSAASRTRGRRGQSLPCSSNPRPVLRVEADGRQFLCTEANPLAADLEIRAPALARGLERLRFRSSSPWSAELRFRCIANAGEAWAKPAMFFESQARPAG